MKKISFTTICFVAALIFASCTNTRKEYQYSITFIVEEQEFNELKTINMDEVCVPCYVCDGNSIEITGHPDNYWHESKVIDKGSKPCQVKEFQYNLVRIYKVDAFTGAEVD